MQQQARRKVLDAARPLIGEIVDQARASGERIVEAYAALSAISDTASAHIPAVDQAREAVGVLIVRGGHGGLLHGAARSRDVTAPAEITQLLGILDGKGAALPTNRQTVFRAF